MEACVAYFAGDHSEMLESDVSRHNQLLASFLTDGNMKAYQQSLIALFRYSLTHLLTNLLTYVLTHPFFHSGMSVGLMQHQSVQIGNVLTSPNHRYCIILLSHFAMN